MKWLRPFVRSGGWTYKIRQGLAAGLKRKGGFGFVPRSLSPEEKFLLELEWKGQTVYDVGGYEGVFTLFFSKAVGPAGRVITFEPNPINCQRIRENIRLNGLDNAQLFQLALGARSGKGNLVYWPEEPARGTLDSCYQESLRQTGDTRCVEIEVDSIDNQLALGRLPAPDFIKIDVEAAELEVVEGMNQTLAVHKPRLFIEIHSGVDVGRLTRNLQAGSYSLHHVESNTRIDLTNTHLAYNGHLYCVPEVVSRA